MSKIISTITASSSPGHGYYQIERNRTMGFKEGDKFILEIGKRKLDEHEIVGTDLYVRRSLLRKLTPYKPQEWIPCEKKLPDTPVRVQVQLDNAWIITAYYDEGKWYAVPEIDNENNPVDGVLAWMPLPEPFKEVPK